MVCGGIGVVLVTGILTFSCRRGPPEKYCLCLSRIEKFNALVVSKSKPVPNARYHEIQHFLDLQVVRCLNQIKDRLVGQLTKKKSSRTPASLSPPLRIFLT